MILYLDTFIPQVDDPVGVYIYSVVACIDNWYVGRISFKN